MCSTEPPKPPPVAPEAPSAAPNPNTSAGAASRRELARQRQKTRGGTLLTGAGGLSGSANTQQKTLLGG